MSVLLAIALIGATEEVWTVQRPLGDIASSLMARADKPELQIPPGLFELADKVNLTAKVYAVPGKHFYRFTLEFGTRRLSGTKTLEVWGKGGATICRSRVNLTFGRNGCLIQWFLHRVERRVIEFERVSLRKLTQED